MNALSEGPGWAARAQLSPHTRQESAGEGLSGFTASVKGQELGVCCYYGLYFSPSAACSFYPLQQVAASISCWSLVGWEELGLGSHSLTPPLRECTAPRGTRADQVGPHSQSPLGHLSPSVPACPSTWKVHSTSQGATSSRLGRAAVAQPSPGPLLCIPGEELQ